MGRILQKKIMHRSFFFTVYFMNVLLSMRPNLKISASPWTHPRSQMTNGRVWDASTDLSVEVNFLVLTWTQCVAGALLHRHALAEGSPVERGRIGARARTFLHAATAAYVAGGPVRPRWPASIHCTCQRNEREEMQEIQPRMKTGTSSIFCQWKENHADSTGVHLERQWASYHWKKVFTKMINGVFPSSFSDLLPKIMHYKRLIRSFAVTAERNTVLRYWTSVCGYQE